MAARLFRVLKCLLRRCSAVKRLVRSRERRQATASEVLQADEAQSHLAIPHSCRNQARCPVGPLHGKAQVPEIRLRVLDDRESAAGVPVALKAHKRQFEPFERMHRHRHCYELRVW